jgi:hypothetical protein
MATRVRHHRRSEVDAVPAAGFDEAHHMLVAAVEQLASSEDWLAVLETSRRLPSYSPRNCLLLAAQGARGVVMGYQAWRRMPTRDGGHCQVKRGATSLKILAPVTKTCLERDEKTGEERKAARLVGFRVASVFDETALVAPPMLPDPTGLRPALLDGDPPERLWDALAAQVAAAGYHLRTDEALTELIAPSYGRTDFRARIVSVRPDLPRAQQAKTLAHELGHVLLHDPERRPDRPARGLAEVEAESVAYLVAGELGLDTSAYTIPYVTGWSDGDAELVLATAHRTIGAARAITETAYRYLTGAELSLPHQPLADSSALAGSDPAAIYDDDPTPSAGDPGEVPGEPSGELVGLATVEVETAMGRWELDWHPGQGTFVARHTTDADQPYGGELTHALGGVQGEIASVGVLEERLGFPLPHSVRDHLAATQRSRPAVLVGARSFTRLYEDEHPTEIGQRERPTPTSRVRVTGKRESSYDAEQPALRVWEDGGYRVEILAAAPVPEPEMAGQQALTYRLLHEHRVIFSGDDILAPADADPASDTAVRQVVTLLCQPDEEIPISRAQAAFLDAHAAALSDLVHPPRSPYPGGTRIVVTTHGDPGSGVTGVVVEPIHESGGPTTSYSWRPDLADLPGHPWRANPGHCFVSPADQVAPTLAAPDTGLADWAPHIPLAYGAVVTFPADDGRPITATVLRAHPTPDGLVYDLQPTGPDTEPVRVPVTDVQPVAGTAWSTVDALLTARTEAGIRPEPAELLCAGGQLARVEDGPEGPAVVRLDHTLGPFGEPADDVPSPLPSIRGLSPPETVTVEHLGDQMRVGDPDHGWLTVPADALVAALAVAPDQLATRLQTGPLRLTGTEPPVTLAALAALHTPDLQPEPPSSALTADQPRLPTGTAPVPSCATPGCTSPVETTVTAGWPNGAREITLRCRPCGTRLALARLPRGCGIKVSPLEAASASVPEPPASQVPL